MLALDSGRLCRPVQSEADLAIVVWRRAHERGTEGMSVSPEVGQG